MDINVMSIIVILILAGLAWWVNVTLNTVPVLNKVVSVIIVVVAVILLLQSLGIMGSLNTHVEVR